MLEKKRLLLFLLKPLQKMTFYEKYESFYSAVEPTVREMSYVMTSQ